MIESDLPERLYVQLLKIILFQLLIFLNAVAHAREEQQTSSLHKDKSGFSQLCPSVHVANLDQISFSEMEKRLVCGDPARDQIGTPWAKIPANQSGYFMKGFLQSRGYHQPLIVQEGEILFVKPGEMSRLRDFRILEWPDERSPPRRRLVIGLPLTSELLDQLQAWSLEQIRNNGYPCSSAETLADPNLGTTFVKLYPGNKMTIKAIEETGDTGLRHGLLDRYNAFRVGDLYREFLITLTRGRIQEEGILQTITFSTRCQDDGVVLVRDVLHGPSRVVRIGAGGSTEEGLRLRAIVRRNRIGESASTAQFRLNLSYLRPGVNRQIADSSFRWFYSDKNERAWLEPLLLYERLLEEAYESLSIEAKFLHGWTIDLGTGQYEIRFGPNVLWSLLSRGFGPERSVIGYLEAGLRWRTHDHEFHANSPRSGGFLETSYLMTQKEWGSGFTAQRYRFLGQKLWNIYRFDPPLFILGLRFDLSSVFSPDEDIGQRLPLRFRAFLGGDEDLRGFERQSLPKSGLGALSVAYIGIEPRIHKVILRRADLFGFLDGASIGQTGFRLERPFFASSGLGVRWESPIGVFRAYVARRFALLEEGANTIARQWRVGITYGEEF